MIAAQKPELLSPLMQLQTPRPALERALRQFVPAFLEERVQGGQQGAWAAEHRKLVSVFMKRESPQTRTRCPLPPPPDPASTARACLRDRWLMEASLTDR